MGRTTAANVPAADRAGDGTPSDAPREPSSTQRTAPDRARRRSFDFGIDAERDVALFLHAGGYRIVGRRVLTRSGEIDVIAVREDTVAFVEVKARSRGWDGLEAVDERKQARLSRAADKWLSQNDAFAGCTVRFDVALVWPGAALEYLENAFEAKPATDFVW